MNQATEDVAEGIIEEDYALFYEIWQEFDPSGTMYMSYGYLSEMLDVLEPPFQVLLFDIRQMYFKAHILSKMIYAKKDKPPKEQKGYQYQTAFTLYLSVCD